MLSSKSQNGDNSLYLPDRNPSFIPRPSFIQLTELMTYDLITPRILYSSETIFSHGGSGGGAAIGFGHLHGSGIGLTNLAIQYGYNAKDIGKYHIIRYMNMNTLLQIKIEWIKFASSLNIHYSSLTVQEIIRLVYHRISSFRYLLIFENIESHQFIQSSLPTDAQPGQHILLVTTSNPVNDLSWPIDYGKVRVDHYTPEETITFVNRFCRLHRLEVISSEENSLKLHDALSGYPLAITLALKYIRQQSQGSKAVLTIDKFLQIFKSKSLSEKYRHLSSGSPLKMLSPLCDLIVEAIKRSAPESAEILEQLCLLFHSPVIPNSLFIPIASSRTPTTSPKAAGAQNSIPFSSESPSSSEDNHILCPYFRYGLLQPVTSHTFTSHSLIQLTLREQHLCLEMTGGEGITRLTGYREEKVLGKAFLPFIRKLYLHVTREEDKTFDEDTQQCIQTAGDCHLHAKHLLAILTSLESGGVTSQSQSLLKKMKVMLLMILGSTLCRLGLYLECLNQYQELQTLLDHSLDNLTDPEIAIPLNFSFQKRLGIVHFQLQKYPEALSSFQSYHQSIETLLGRTHGEYEQSLLLLGNASLAAENYAEAHGFYEQVLILQRSIYPELHVRIAQSLHAIASVFAAQEIFVEAILLFRESLSIKKKVFPGSPHSETIKTLLEIGKIYERQRKYSQALSQYEEVYLLIQRSPAYSSSSSGHSSGSGGGGGGLGDSNHVMLTIILDRLGAIHKLENRLQDSLDSCQQSFQIKRRIYPENHFEIAQSMQKIAEIFAEQGKHTLALDWFQQTFHMKLMLFPEIHEEIAKTTYCIGAVYASQGKYVQALESFLNCLNTQRHLILSLKTGGNRLSASELLLRIKNHEISETLLQIGKIYQNQGRYLQALTSYEEALQLQQQLYQEITSPLSSPYLTSPTSPAPPLPPVLSTSSPSSPTSSVAETHRIMITQLMCHIGSVYKSQEQYPKALQIYQDAFQIQKLIYGSTHIEIATTLSNIASIFTSQGQYSDSIEYLKQALCVKKGVYLPAPSSSSSANQNQQQQQSTHQSIIVTEEMIKRIENQRELKSKILKLLSDYIENREKGSEMVSSSYSLGMAFSKEEKIQAARFVVRYVEESGLERLGELMQSEEFQRYEKPLTNGRLGQLVKSLLDEIYARENMLPAAGGAGAGGSWGGGGMVGLGRSRGSTI
jgi:tetratricopeptide (TPR) repeat protein